ncbi:hypothetical protein SAMN02745866_02795 [Alteromonadaceae bacterium Bs31]|nr:hypothetical protein SAMN02745866_02795 [Alteromonadaceae bacterium Bs31]
MALKLNKFNKENIKSLLSAHYSAPLSQTFKQFRSGAIFFAVGLIIVYLANTTLPPSAKQELIVLLGLLIAIGGFTVAMLAHIRMLISRALKFFRDK